MFVELHILQNFVPSNLNRDDTNSPKDCEFGGVRRARVSSQCLKRAMRREFGRQALLPAEDQGVRTKRLVEALEERFVAAGKPEDEAVAVAEVAIKGLGLGLDKKNPESTEYLLFLGRREIDRLVDTCLRYWDQAVQASVGDKKGKDKTAVGELGNALQGVLDGGRAVDLSLFGRMLADIPERNIDAASQVAHAISTHKVGVEFDFYTAVDDLNPETTEGAGMMGTVEFNSACFYRYANIDMGQFTRNLREDRGLAREGLRAFVQACIDAVPTGKQNSMAAHNPPSFVMAVVRRDGLQNLANAFVRPVSTSESDDLVEESIHALDTYWGKLSAMYGTDGIVGTWVATTDGDNLRHLPNREPVTVGALIDAVVGAATAE